MRVRFGEFVFDSLTRELSCAGELRPLPPKACDLLAALLASRPEALSRQQLYERLWPGTFVSQASLTWAISQLRKALGDDARRPRFVRTLHRFGYAFCGQARVEAEALPASRDGPRCWLVWAGREIELCDGEHLLGRAPTALLRMSSSRVSRRHARITVAAGRAVVEDLASKNGTYLGGTRIEGPTELTDGCEICIGSEVLTFHAADAALSTERATRH